MEIKYFLHKCPSKRSLDIECTAC